MIAKPHNPPSLHPPFSAYSLGMEVSGAERWLHLSGQVGVKKDGSVPPSAEGQMEECWTSFTASKQSSAVKQTQVRTLRSLRCSSWPTHLRTAK